MLVVVIINKKWFSKLLSIPNNKAPFFPESLSTTSIIVPTIVGIIDRSMGIILSFFIMK